jgi:D-alanine-D-alanine ligase
MPQIRVGVVRGGPSSEYPVSLKTGERVLRDLNKEKYLPVDILLTTRGEWYMNGIRSDIFTIAHHVDVVWNALHGTFGEDGKVQQLFESFSIPYTGSDILASAIGMHKGLAKERFAEAGLLVPKGEVLDAQSDLVAAERELFRHYLFPLIVKPVSGGSSVATRVVKNFDELVQAMQAASKHGDVLVEEYIKGDEATCCVLDSGVPDEYFALHPIEIVPHDSRDFFDYEAKYAGESEEICPGRFPLATHGALRDLATKAHQSIGARHYSRSDFIISPRGIYILEINTLPGLTEASLLPKALEAGGVAFPDFLDHVIGLALPR